MLSYVPGISTLSQVVYLSGIAYGPSVYLTVIGSLVIVLSFMGCGGAFKRKHHIVMVFGLITLLMMLFNICVVMFYAIDPYYIQGTVETNMYKILEQDFTPENITGSTIILPSNENARAWITMQSEQSCCGVKGPEDYMTFTWDRTNIISAVLNATIPPSCCLQITPNSSYLPIDISAYVNLTTCISSINPYMDANTQGCVNYVMAEVTRYDLIYPVVAAGLTGLQAIILCMTMWLLVIHMDRLR
jgi:uncharacterized membrane protein